MIDLKEIFQSNDVANVANSVVNVANKHELTHKNEAVYKFISIHRTASTKEISKNPNLNIRTVQRAIKELEELGIIKKQGTRNNIQWLILK